MITRLLRPLFCLIFISSIGPKLSAQVNVSDSAVFAPLFHATVGFHLPSGDLESRFGNFATLGGGMVFKTKKNLLWGVESHFQYGNQVKETSMLNWLRANNGEIINLAGRYASVFYFQRGIDACFTVGKIIPVFGPNKNSGIRINFGAGYWQHRVKIEDAEGGVFYLRDEYLPGFDRKTGGLLLKEYVGYHHQGDTRIANFSLGFEFNQGFTRSLRDFNYDTQSSDQSQRLDLSFGLRLSWIIPFYKKTPQEFYYY